MQHNNNGTSEPSRYFNDPLEFCLAFHRVAFTSATSSGGSHEATDAFGRALGMPFSRRSFEFRTASEDSSRGTGEILENWICKPSIGPCLSSLDLRPLFSEMTHSSLPFATFKRSRFSYASPRLSIFGGNLLFSSVYSSKFVPPIIQQVSGNSGEFNGDALTRLDTEVGHRNPL